jgi:hypothetical protein
MFLEKERTHKIRTRYDRISRYYDFMESPLEKLLFSQWRRRVFDVLDGDNILEVGVGTGKNFDFYPVGKSITGIDFSKGMLRRARPEEGPEEGVEGASGADGRPGSPVGRPVLRYGVGDLRFLFRTRSDKGIGGNQEGMQKRGESRLVRACKTSNYTLGEDF